MIETLDLGFKLEFDSLEKVRFLDIAGKIKLELVYSVAIEDSELEDKVWYLSAQYADKTMDNGLDKVRIWYEENWGDEEGGNTYKEYIEEDILEGIDKYINEELNDYMDEDELEEQAE